MQIKVEQLKAHLKQGLQPIYFVYGDELLLVQEACDAIRGVAREQGYTEREVYFVEAGFDWGDFSQAGAAMSLFSERKLIELRLPSGKPGDAGSKALQAYAARPSPDNVLLIQAGKLDAQTRRGKWYKALEKSGAVIQVWPMDVKQMRGWTMRRMKQKGLQASQEAVVLLVERVEGNLLACAQEIEKLLLQHGPSQINLEQVASSVTDSSRFDIYKLVDNALQGDAVRTARIINALKGEGVEPVLLLWALTRELRALADMAYQVAHGAALEQVMSKARVWKNRQALVKAGLKRHKVIAWQRMLQHAGRIDAIIKGGQPGNVWDELLALSLLLGGLRLHPVLTGRPLSY